MNKEKENKEKLANENLFENFNLEKDQISKKKNKLEKVPTGTINPSYISTQYSKKYSANLTKRNIQLATKVDEVTYEKLKTAAQIEGCHLVRILEKAIDEY